MFAEHLPCVVAIYSESNVKYFFVVSAVFVGKFKLGQYLPLQETDEQCRIMI